MSIAYLDPDMEFRSIADVIAYCDNTIAQFNLQLKAWRNLGVDIGKGDEGLKIILRMRDFLIAHTAEDLRLEATLKALARQGTRRRIDSGQTTEQEGPEIIKCPECGAEKNFITMGGHLVREHGYSSGDAARKIQEIRKSGSVQ